MEYIEDIQNLFKNNPDPFGWAEVSYQYDTGRGYQHPQDLKADFINKFTHLVEHRVNWFWEQKGYINYGQLEELIYQFRKHFPNKSRIPNIAYFDDHIQDLIDKYKRMEANQALIEVETTTTEPPPVGGLYRNIFNRMPILEANNFFMQLATNNSVNGMPYLTIAQVQAFIERGFMGKPDIPKLTFNYGSKEKFFIWKLFYKYNQRCISIENGVERSAQCRDKYIKLLTDNFTNFTFEEVEANFSKSNQVKKDWNLLD